MKNLSVYLMILFLAFTYSTSAYSQIWDDDEPIDEIVVVGRQTDYGFAGFGSIFDFLGFQEFFSDGWLSQLNELLDNANEANDQYCTAKIESWRADCHHQMNVRRWDVQLSVHLHLLPHCVA